MSTNGKPTVRQQLRAFIADVQSDSDHSPAPDLVKEHDRRMCYVLRRLVATSTSKQLARHVADYEKVKERE